ncbi:hypothetical protein KAH37_08165 [bacterium]|nr:hypothetical protein [bacterium]
MWRKLLIIVIVALLVAVIMAVSGWSETFYNYNVEWIGAFVEAVISLWR